MKKMVTLVLIAVCALTLAAILVARHRQQRSVLPPAATAETSPAALPVMPATPMNALQSGVKLDPRTDYRPDADAKRRLLERLHQEEKRQKPEEGRN